MKKMKRFYYIIITMLAYVFPYEIDAQTANSCTASFKYQVRYEVSPFTYQFVDTSFSNSAISKWEWNFGNGESSNKQNPEHQFLDAGDYIVSLRIENIDGGSSTFSDTIHVEALIFETCNAYFTYLRDTTLPLYSYKFFDHSLHSNDTIISWIWDFGDSSPWSYSQHPTHQYSSTGTYHAKLSINTTNGCSSYYIATIIVSSGNVDCDASFTHTPDTIATNANTVLFHDNSLHSSAILSWRWYFGDGDSSIYQDPVHTFPYDGIYTVKLKITTSICNSEIEIPIQVGNPQKYNFWGRVYVGNLTVDKCVAYLYRDFQNGTVIPIDTVNLTSVNDTLGVYYFYQIPEGFLKVQVRLPNNSQFINDFAPSYFQNSVFWQDAQNIALFQNLSLQNVFLIEIVHQIGSDFISGQIINQANGQIEGVLVYLFNDQGDIIDYTYTNASGFYYFDQVPMGNYYVFGELAGFASYPASVSFTSPNDSIWQVNFLIKGKTSVGFIQTEELRDDFEMILYPNPIGNDHLNLSFNNYLPSDYIFYLYDISGMKLTQGILEAGKKHFQIQSNHLSSGVYVLKINDLNGKTIRVEKIIR